MTLLLVTRGSVKVVWSMSSYQMLLTHDTDTGTGGHNYDAVDVEYEMSDATDVVGIDVCNHKINEV